MSDTVRDSVRINFANPNISIDFQPNGSVEEFFQEVETARRNNAGVTLVGSDNTTWINPNHIAVMEKITGH